jgi:flavin reductase (DIM6/NTAB) family NADH-FMN oxidoreductase RutF
MQTRTTFDEAIRRRCPQPVAIVLVADGETGRHNAIPVEWIMQTSHEPPLLAIAIGAVRYSLAAIRSARAFVVSFPSAAMAEDTTFFGTRSGRDTDKLAARGSRTQPAAEIDGVLLADAVANFECTLEKEEPTGDHVIFVGRVVACHTNPDTALGRLYTLAGEDYTLGGV